MVQVNLISPPHIPDIWKVIEPFLERAIHHAPEHESAAEFYQPLMTGVFGLFVITNGKEFLGVAVIQRLLYPYINICLLKLVAGDKMHEWLPYLEDAVYNWAAVNDCQLVRIQGRPGWKKFYKEYGYSLDKVIFSKPVIANIH